MLECTLRVEQSLPMRCSSCHQQDDHLIKTFVAFFNTNGDRSNLATCRVLCRPCMVGYVVPVWRPTLQKWGMGEATEFDEHTAMHHVTFLDETEDWAIVSQSPYDDYLAFYRERARKRRASNEDDDITHHSLSPSERVSEDTNAESPDKENGEMMQMILTQVSVHSNEHDADDSDWTLRRVAETCGTSPARPTPPWKGWHPAQANSEKPDSQATQPAEKPLTSLENGPLNDRGTDLHNNKKPETVPFTGFFFYQGSGSNRRVGSKMWTLEEDKDLIKYVEAASTPIKWTAVAESIPGRNGKQCRERYMNHLKPRLKMEEWSAVEDAMIFQMYLLFGSKWSRMRKILPGRTDNRIKNRFHFLSRRLDNDAARLLQGNSIGIIAPSLIHLNGITSMSGADVDEEHVEIQYKIQAMLPHLAAETIENSGTTAYSFGTFHAVEGNTNCNRCSLMVPSLQTGRAVCQETGWCEACTRVPPYVTGNMLQQCLKLRNGDSMPNKSIKN